MSKNWYKEAEKALEPGDAIQKSFPAILDGGRGYVILTNKRLMFQNVKGFLSKKYNITMNIPMESIEKTEVKDRYSLEIASGGKKYSLDTDEIPANVIDKSITEITKPKKEVVA
ncbi:hypothetical protein JXL21_13100 [Candidatus Bathyarchaeota archaeon]|nr:hypothetical protein [Candidatus Bathyarchaeota archaeon]